MSNGKHPRSSKVHSDKPKLLNLNPHEHKWIRTIPDYYPDIMRAPAVTYKAERDDTRVKSNKYIAFSRPYRGKQGLLIIGKEQRSIIIDETQPDKPQILPMRLDREAIQGTWVFAISIFHAEGIVQIEDCIVADGEQIRSTKPYSERFVRLQKFTDTVWFQDLRFQCNWNIKVVDLFSLDEIKSAATTISGGNLCLMPDLATFRLLKVMPTLQEKVKIIGGSNEYTCHAVEGKPDVYDLKNLDGSELGRASIQTLTISQALQEKKNTGQTMRVLAEWNEEFESYIVTCVL